MGSKCLMQCPGQGLEFMQGDEGNEVQTDMKEPQPVAANVYKRASHCIESTLIIHQQSSSWLSANKAMDFATSRTVKTCREKLS